MNNRTAMQEMKKNAPAPSAMPRRMGDLLTLLGQQQGLYAQLAEAIALKGAAMRRADLHAMREMADREQALAERLAEREGLRRQLMDLIGAALGLSPAAARALSISELQARVGEPWRARLQDAAKMLRETVSQLAQAHRLVSSLSREVLGHLQWVMDSIRPRGDESAGYAGDGRPVSPGDLRIFETVG